MSAMATDDRRASNDLPAGISRARLRELYLPTTKGFVFVDVPQMRFAMVDGEGNPDDEPYRRAVRWLFGAIYPLKRIAKERMGKDFVEPPLERTLVGRRPERPHRGEPRPAEVAGDGRHRGLGR
jgi:hypothetical protein